MSLTVVNPHPIAKLNGVADFGPSKCKVETIILTTLIRSSRRAKTIILSILIRVV